MTKSSIGKISICAEIGVCEIWRWTGDHFVVLERNDSGEYQLRQGSGLLPQFQMDVLSELTLLAIREGQPAALRELRARLRGGASGATRPTA